MDARREFARRHHHFRPPLIAVADVHEFDETHDHGRAAKTFDEIERRVIVHAALDDGIDFDRRQPRGDGGLDAGEHLIERAESAAHARKNFLVQRVQAHRDAPQAIGVQIDRMLSPSSTPLVVSAMSSMPGMPVRSPTKSAQIRAQQRLAAGEAQLAHPQAREQPGETHDFIERQSLLRLQELIVLVELLLGHAVRAAKIAAVHDRNAQIVQRPAEPIERVLRAANVVNGGFMGSDHQRYTLATNPLA